MFALPASLGIYTPGGPPTPPPASIISSIQTFEITIAGGATSNTATISSVTTSRSVIFYGGFNTTYTGSTHNNWAARVELTNATTVTAIRTGTTSTVTVRGTVVEFDPGAISSVQQATANIANNNTSGTATISSVDTSRSALFFLGWSLTGAGSSAVRPAFATVELTDATTVTAFRDLATTNLAVDVGFCIVEFASGIINSIQSRAPSFVGTATTNSDTISSVTTANTILLYNGVQGASTTLDNWMYYLSLTSSTNVDCIRGDNASASRSLRYMVVEFVGTHINSLQRGAIALTGNTPSADVTITSVNTAKAVGKWTGVSTVGVDDFSEQFGSAKLLDATTVRAQKDNGEAGDNMTVGWEVIEFV